MQSETGSKRKSIIEDTEDEEELLEINENENKPEKTDPNQGILYYLLNNHLWIFAIWLIPISLCYDIFWWCRARMNYWMCKRNAHLRHDDKVSSFSDDIFNEN